MHELLDGRGHESQTGRVCVRSKMIWIFFFQAEDGIRDDLVTGVQTCALPILMTMLKYMLKVLKT